MNYYNEFDPKAAAWLRELIKQGLIADGVVDERSITEVSSGDVAGFNQCHFFAGIGGWSYALRLAGVPDDYPLWTGSCPCQPFSAAGKGLGTADERHLWPVFARLINECRPPRVFGEQVASKAGRDWLSSVRSDLEAMGYAVGAADLCAAGVGAPHIRQRLYFVGLSDTPGVRHKSFQERQPPSIFGEMAKKGEFRGEFGAYLPDADGGLAYLHDTRPQGRVALSECADERAFGAGGVGGRLADAEGIGCEPRALGDEDQKERQDCGGGQLERLRLPGVTSTSGNSGANAINGNWTTPDWLYCRDAKWRPVESGTFPLAHGIPAKVGRLRGYGNAIVPQVAQAFIEAVLCVRSNNQTY